MSKPWPWTHTTEPNNRVGPTPTSSVGITRDLGRARDAYKKRGVEASRAAHDGVRPSHELRRSSTSTDTATDTASSRSEISELPPSDRYRPALPPIVGTRRALEKHSNTPSEYIKSMVRACLAQLPRLYHRAACTLLHSPCMTVSRRRVALSRAWHPPHIWPAKAANQSPARTRKCTYRPGVRRPRRHHHHLRRGRGRGRGGAQCGHGHPDGRRQPGQMPHSPRQG